MESSEAVPTGKSCNQETPGLLVGQTTEELESWKLNEQQQQLVDASGLGNLIHTASLAIDRAVIRAFCEFWSKETNTARFHDFEMAPSLRDTAYILGVPVIGRAVTTGAVLNKSSEQLFSQYLGRIPGRKDCRGSRVKLSWLHSKFSKLSEHPTDIEIEYSTRAYLLYLIGATLFPEHERGYISPKYLPLLSDFEKVREYAWGAAALAHLYKALSAVMSSAKKRLFGSAALLMGWIYEYIPAMRPDMEDAPALIFPRVCRWTGRATSQQEKEISDIVKTFSQLRVSDVNWKPYKDMNPASIPSNCAAPDNVCSSRTWLISFNVREVYAPDRFSSPSTQKLYPLKDVPGFQRHQWSASVDWSLEYASEIKHFEQLINASSRPHTTVPDAYSTSTYVFTPATTAREFLGLNLVTVVENIKKELPTIARFREQCSLPVELARSLARIHELVEASHSKEGNDSAVDAQSGGTSQPQLTVPHPPAIPVSKQATTMMATGMQHCPEIAELTEHEPVQNGSGPVPECGDAPRKGGVEDSEVEKVSGTEEEEEEEEEEAGEGNRDGEPEATRKRPRRCTEGGSGGLRRSSRRCVQAKRFRHRGGKGSEASDPIVL